MKTLKSILPKTSGSGGTRVGSSFLNDFKVCPYYWYLQHLAPHPSGGYGSEPRFTPDALWLGGISASAMQAWRTSGWKDGAYDFDAGMSALLAESERRAPEVFDLDHWAELQSEVIHFLTRLWKWAGPGGPDPDWERYRVAPDGNGLPLIEREFEIDLGWEGYFYTTKPDAVVWRLNDDKLCALDDKTCSASNATATVGAKSKASQLTGEQYAVHLTWPATPNGFLGNFIIKNAAGGKPPRRLEDLDRTEARMELFRVHTIRLLQQMERSTEEYLSLLTTGLPEPLAARSVFSDEPSESSCYQYNRACPFLDSCIGALPSLSLHSHTTKPRYGGPTAPPSEGTPAE